ncbi:MAG: anaerobic sulfatase maturase [Rhodocyclaceae bacterium]|nr:anaerobic sulfatase maturase [Rhodocyclaceae bacterium]MCA3092353.1 anaerobic sulfatase maturase [Rhodocyclaceae bacterium]MCA3097185.1 anaerobic sulfatase maturase [Rhodocyclaceae bacterium]MCA3103906.1 anaerobic sulfatase maturase [Rhodocyclaceae bacterium]MCA3114135.1 anaerobic sulfatase maturase [Rhodocyclaceae bacterium]
MPDSGPPGFHLLAKPSGSTCNIDCTYCFFLSKEALYPNDRSRMSAATLEAYIRQLLESHRVPEVTVAWQGGEPTLMKLEFFEHAVELVEKYRRPGQTVKHTFQTNGLLLDDAWCRFFKQHDFLVGLSVDGPRELHDTYRLDRRGKGTFDLVMKGWRALRRHDVEFNILCTVNAANQHHGRTVYRFFRDELGAKWVQFIPIVERATEQTIGIANKGWSEVPGEKRLLYTQTGNLVTERTVGSEQYGRFLIDVFEEWVRRDVGQVYVQLFDVTLEAFFGRHLLCIHAPTCGYGPALEHNGDLYSCDHFVEPKHLLGNIHKTHMLTMVASPEQRRFGQGKRDSLTQQCQTCKVRNWCNGGCPKDRFALSKDGEPGQNYLCAGLEKFFMHTGPTFNVMAQLYRKGHPPAEVMTSIAALDARRDAYQPCPCGSGSKFRFCHGDRDPKTPFSGVEPAAPQVQAQASSAAGQRS